MKTISLVLLSACATLLAQPSPAPTALPSRVGPVRAATNDLPALPSAFVPVPKAPTNSTNITVNPAATSLQDLVAPKAAAPKIAAPATNAPAPALPPLPVPTLTPPANAIAPRPAPIRTVVPAAPTNAATNPPNILGQLPRPVREVGASTNALILDDKMGDKIIAAGVLKFNNTPLEQVLDIYADMVKRTIIRSPAVQGTMTITLKSQTDLTLKEAIQAIDSVLALNGIAILPLGEKFITVVPIATVLTEGAAFNTSTNNADLPEAGQYVTKILQLTHAKPSEVQPVIQSFAKIQGGILPIDSTQVLVLRDYAVNIKRMLEIIQKLDVAIPLEETMEVIPIKYALASEISSVLGSLTSGGSSGGAAGGRTTATGRNTGGGVRRPGTTGTGLPGTPGIPGQPTPGVATPGANVNAFQQQLQRIVGNAANAANGAPLLGSARIIPYERNNAILVIGTKEELKMVKELIEKLDRVQPQVLIEAIFMEVSLSGNKSFGVSFAQNSHNFGGNNIGQGGVNNGNFISGITNITSGGNSALPSAFSYYGNLGKMWEVAVSAAESDSTITILSRPRIQTSHAETATLFIGETVPYVTGTYFGGVSGQATSQYTQKEIGISLSVQPIINDDGLVVLDIVQNVEALGEDIKVDNNNVPKTTKRNAQSKVAVKDGDTIILGGFISSNKTKTKGGVPVLKDIPYLGALFRNSSDSTSRKELIVLLRPTVLKTPDAATVVAAAEREKLSTIKRAEMELRAEETKLKQLNEKAIQQGLKDGTAEK